MDYLKFKKASVVGWSDGAITALDLLLNHPDRLDRVYAFAQNFEIAGVKDISGSPVFTEYISRAVSDRQSYDVAALTEEFSLTSLTNSSK